MAELTLAIGEVRAETPRTRVVRVPLGGHPLPFRAGQAVLLGTHGQPLRRPFSIACSPEQAVESRALEFLIQVTEDVGAGPHLAVIEPGVLLDVEGPAGEFVFPDEAPEKEFLFVGGGTGIAPLRSMLWHALVLRPDARFALLYSARDAEEFAYEEEFSRLARAGRITFHHTITREAPAGWQGGRGRIGLAELGWIIHTPATHCFVCGPASLVEEVPALLAELGIDARLIQTEQWIDRPKITAS